MANIRWYWLTADNASLVKSGQSISYVQSHDERCFPPSPEHPSWRRTLWAGMKLPTVSWVTVSHGCQTKSKSGTYGNPDLDGESKGETQHYRLATSSIAFAHFGKTRSARWEAVFRAFFWQSQRRSFVGFRRKQSISSVLFGHGPHCPHMGVSSPADPEKSHLESR